MMNCRVIINTAILLIIPACGSNNSVNTDNPLSIKIVPATSTQCISDGSQILIYNGGVQGTQDGHAQPDETAVICNGQTIEDPMSIVEAIAPCGNTVTYKEILLRLHNGSIIASFSSQVSGYLTRLIVLPDGVYSDTDDSGCSFTLSTEGQVRSISWDGGGESWVIN